jgi:GNAT superfamily N-acetyltransferase
MQIEEVVEHYPKNVKLKDGTAITLRLLKQTDEKAFHTFFVGVPEQERILFKHRVTEPAVIREWVQRIDYTKILPIVAYAGDQLVADASLHQTLGGWKRHIGRISVVVHPSIRGKGLAGTLVNELIDIARDLGLEKLEAEFLGEQKAARRVFEERGFNQFLYLQDYVKDMQAIAHDYVLMGRDLLTDEEYTGAQ